MSELENMPYDQWLAPLESLLKRSAEYVEAAQTIMNNRGLPDASSEMMNDLSGASSYISDELEEPIESVAMTSVLSTFASQESLCSSIRLVRTGPPPPIYSADVLCRSSVDLARPAWWLTERGIGTERRVQRMVAEKLYSAEQMKRLVTDGDAVALGTTVADRMRSYAAGRGWPAQHSNRLTAIGDERRPTVPDLLEAEFGDRRGAQTVWAELSAVTHGTQFALARTIDLDSIQNGKAITGTNTLKVSARLELSAHVVLESTNRYISYMGWGTPELTDASNALAADLRGRILGRRG